MENLKLRYYNDLNKILPEKFLNLNKQQTALLLNRIFAGDGWYGKSDNRNEVGIASLSKIFLEQINFLLNKFGIYGSINQVKNKNKPFYKLRFASLHDVTIFKNEIDIYDKQLRFPIIRKNKSKRNPFGIKSIKYVGKEMAYDLTTEKYHNYFANGINVHNSGFSTSIVGKVVYESYFNVVPEICVVSATKIQANKVLDRIRDAFKSMHPSLQPEFENENAGYLKLKNGCKIYSLSSNPNSARGFTGNVYLDEFAILSMKISYELWSALYPSITHGGRIVTVSTPKGKVGKFFELCSQEIKEDQKINKIIYKINWRDIPFIVDGVKNKGLFEGLSQEDIEQEYELTFLTDSEEPYFSKDFIMDNYIDVDGNILLYNDYEDLGIPDEYFKDLNKPLEEKYIIAWNKQISHLLDTYSRFVGAWDIASTNDDSIFKVAGQVRGTDIYHIIGEFLLNKVSTDTTEQAKYIKRVISCFNLESLCTDYKGLGRGVVDFLCASDGTSYGEEFAEKMDDIIIKHETTLQNKIDLYSATKQAITSGKRKRRYDGSKYDNDKLKQFSNVYLMGGKLVKKNGKDDYADCEVLLTRAIEGDVVQDGIIFLEKNKIHYGARNDGSSIFPRRS